MADIQPAVAEPDLDLLALNAVLENLETHDHRMAELVKLHFFPDQTIEQVAQVLGLSTSTADNDWTNARCQSRLGIER